MYPLNMNLPAPAVGFALANDATEHQSLTSAGYGPAYVAPATADVAPATTDQDALMAEAEAKGIKVDKRWSAARLAEEVAKA